jgi:septum formation topological specificity factor MinE
LNKDKARHECVALLKILLNQEKETNKLNSDELHKLRKEILELK